MTNLSNEQGPRSTPEAPVWAIGRPVNDYWLEYVGDLFEELAPPALELELREEPGVVYVAGDIVDHDLKDKEGELDEARLEQKIYEQVATGKLPETIVETLHVRRKSKIGFYTPKDRSDIGFLEIEISDVLLGGASRLSVINFERTTSRQHLVAPGHATHNSFKSPRRRAVLGEVIGPKSLFPSLAKALGSKLSWYVDLEPLGKIELS